MLTPGSYYSIEPTDFPGTNQTLKNELVSGVEACMWSEYVDGTNFMSRMWPVYRVCRGWGGLTTACSAPRRWASVPGAPWTSPT